MLPPSAPAHALPSRHALSLCLFVGGDGSSRSGSSFGRRWKPCGSSGRPARNSWRSTQRLPGLYRRVTRRLAAFVGFSNASTGGIAGGGKGVCRRPSGLLGRSSSRSATQMPASCCQVAGPSSSLTGVVIAAVNVAGSSIDGGIRCFRAFLVFREEHGHKPLFQRRPERSNRTQGQGALPGHRFEG